MAAYENFQSKECVEESVGVGVTIGEGSGAAEEH